MAVMADGRPLTRYTAYCVTTANRFYFASPTVSTHETSAVAAVTWSHRAWHAAINPSGAALQANVRCIWKRMVLPCFKVDVSS